MPGEKDLHPYQKFCVNFLEEKPQCALFLDCGLGKTIITLTAISHLLYDSYEVSRVLIIAPLRVARDTWIGELSKWEHLKGMRMENTICKIVDLEREINRDIDQLVDLKAEAREALAQMPNPDESLILELRYFSRKTWEKIAEETGYSVRHVTRLHGRGLQHFRIPDKSVLKCP